MSLALTEEQRALGQAVREFVADSEVRQAARDSLEAAADELPSFWKALSGTGWVGLHLPEELGGQDGGWAELAVVVEQLALVCAPGPFVPTALAAGVVCSHGSDDLRRALLPALAAGSRTAAVGFGGTLRLSPAGLVSGAGGPVIGAAVADLLLLPVGDDVVVVDRVADGVEVTPADSLDRTRRLAAVACADVRPRGVLVGARRESLRAGRVLAAAEAAGLARACVEMATGYAKIRKQFGRAVGAFQAVAHHCANMLVDAELATAAAWDAARAGQTADEADLAAAVAAAQALPAALRCAGRNIQVHGGIGYTWEHDAHLFFRRAATLVAVFEAEADALDDVVRHYRDGVRPVRSVPLPPEAELVRAEARRFRHRFEALPPAERRAALIDSGYLVPHYPRPYGRGADPVEQLVIEAEFAGLELPDLGIGAWILPTLIHHGDPAQLERWIRPSLEGSLRWCQLFSEPEAGSDAAAIRSVARRVEGGWRLDGQKIWTSDAAHCNRGLATVRTDPAQRKHAGVTMVVVDLEAPGVQVRPLREITGDALFNEVFLDDVFVPDTDVVGEVGQGWAVARSALGNERVTIGSGRAGDVISAQTLLSVVARYRPDDRASARDVGRLLAEEQAMAMLNLRTIERAIGGDVVVAEGNVTKLLSAEHAQRVAELALVVAGAPAVAGAEPRLTRELLFARCLTIGGGTSEISRNQIAERLLGLPRDPLLTK